MTYYEQEVERIRREYLPCEDILERCRMARRIMDAECCSGIELDELCRRLYVSKFHFIRQFSRCYGRTPHRYLTERRMQTAREFLGIGLTVAETCSRVGFTSVTSFVVLFKRFNRYTPSQYRQMRNFR